jgi:quercetin dioxygenase-like cupin family protein
MKEKIDNDVMKQVFQVGGAKPVVLPSGSTQWKVAEIGPLSLYVVDNMPGAAFSEKGHPEEVLAFVLEGQVTYDNGRVARAGEAAFHLPDTAYGGRYAGCESVRVVLVKAMPKPGSKSPQKSLMEKPIRPHDIAPFRRPPTGSVQRILVATDTFSVCYLENAPVIEFPEPGHPEMEIIYVLAGKVEYTDGRIVRPGEAACNIANMPHEARYAGTQPIRLLEIDAPANVNLARWGCL